MGNRLNWSSRQSPTDLDQPPSKPTYEFDLRRNIEPGAKSSWPERLQGEKFGPSFISKAWKSGLVVVAEIEGYPRPVAVAECKWGINGTLLVKTLEGNKVAQRIWTRKSAKGLSSCGELLSEEE